jgi:hypothetical protein
MTKPINRPFWPPERNRDGTALVRAAATYALAYISSTDKRAYLSDANVDRVLKQRWPTDKDTELLVKAAMTPTSMASASVLALTTVPDFFVSMGPASAGAELLKAGLTLSFNGSGAISVPGVIATAGNAGFVGETKPIPHRQLPVTAAILQPRKFATITSFSRETFENSAPSIEGVVRTVLTESVGLALDAAMFSVTAGDADRPPGLLLGIAPLTPSANADHNQACIEDVGTLAAAVSVVAANGPLVFVCAPKQAVTLRLRTFLFPYTVLASSALPDKTVVCVAANTLASATDPLPRFEISDKGATLHHDDTPVDISTPGSPPVMAFPVVSTFQADQVALRMIFEMSWGLRSPSGLAWMQNVVW